LTVLAEIIPRVTRAYRAISHEEAEARVEYHAAHLPEAPTSEEQVAGLLRSEIARRTARDVERGFTSVGPHVDDLGLSLTGHSARAFASQGQQRALIIALKIAEIENLQEACQVSPVLLLDDVSSELDPDRNGQLMRYLAEARTQVFLSTTDPRLVAEAVGRDAKYYVVDAGRLTPTDPPQAPPRVN
jgi:DNA replication and repair protein RecF